MVAHRVREASSAGSTFEMSCQVTGQNLQNPGYSVLVRTEEKAGAASRKVLSLSPDSVLQLEEWTEPGRVDSVALEKTGPLEYRFRLYGAQLSDRGFYYCDVTAFTREQGGGATGSDAGAGTGSAGGADWSRVVSAESNKIQIAFEDTGTVEWATTQPASFAFRSDSNSLVYQSICLSLFDLYHSFALLLSLTPTLTLTLMLSLLLSAGRRKYWLI